jgi:hypothetical protein
MFGRNIKKTEKKDKKMSTTLIRILTQCQQISHHSKPSNTKNPQEFY